jgi:hypothetical protein
VDHDEILSKGRQRRKVKARSLLCFLGCKGIRHVPTALAMKLEMSIAGVGFAVERGELVAKKRNFMLIN